MKIRYRHKNLFFIYVSVTTLFGRERDVKKIKRGTKYKIKSYLELHIFKIEFKNTLKVISCVKTKKYDLF